MEFDTGPDVQPGHDISIETSSGTTDLGEATYDSDHDGVADSVIVIEDDHEYVITDSDHDGQADSMHAYDENGHEVDPKTGAPIDGSSDGPGDGTTGTDTGASTTDHTGSTDGTTTDGTSSSTSSGTSTTDGSTTDASDSSTSSSDSGHDITVTGDDGSAHSLGAPTVDLDHDGSPDTAVIHNSDGSVTGYTDRDGDGTADQITQIGADGKVVIAVSDGHGGWEVTTTGHVDSSGNLVPDSSPDPDVNLDPADSDGVSAGHPAGASTSGSTSSGTSSTSGASSTSTSSGTTDTTDTSTSDHTSGSSSTDSTADAGFHEPVPDSAPISGDAPSGDITFSEDGKDYDLGHPTTDLNGDGTPDTVVTHLSDGTVVGYTDTDGDGTADQITQISSDGSVVIGVSDGHGGWEQAATGHIGSDGKFVPDAAAGATTG